jgi:hypothetical protein
MRFTKRLLILVCLISGTLVAQEAKVAELMSKDLANLPGKEGLMITVEYPPGSVDSGKKSAKLIKGAKGVNADLLDFLRSVQKARKAA